jgi:hypothetical protein
LLAPATLTHRDPLAAMPIRAVSCHVPIIG